MTAIIYGSPCESMRKAVKWFEKNNISYIERNILANPLNVQELQKILELTSEGTDEIIATRSKIYKELNLDFDTLTLLELLNLIEKHPTLLRNPIVVDNKRMMVGYNEDDIRKFIPRKVRKRQWLQLQMESLNC
ncbi:transcriptional regulator Spx [Calidifontibacillus oryziterrae]|uniref:transcriptional regulator Spx n=1 Tax=Calidifontibacillus oryziterrae TaxID=1191699 RepID=UPI000307736A|nr:transcriptional regulator Spx [Calidifontibacillus oryziterrae]